MFDLVSVGWEQFPPFLHCKPMHCVSSAADRYLSTFTTKQMPSSYQHHTDKQMELYCPDHRLLNCVDCSTASQHSRDKMMGIADTAKEKGRELGQQAEGLRNKEREIAKQIQAVKKHFKARRQKVKVIFDDIRQHLERRYQEVIDQIQAEEDASLTSLADHDKFNATLMSDAGTLNKMVTSAGDVVLLSVTEQLKSGLNDVESLSKPTVKVKAVGSMTFDSKMVLTIKSAVSNLGKVNTSEPATTTPTTVPTSFPNSATSTITSTTTTTSTAATSTIMSTTTTTSAATTSTITSTTTTTTRAAAAASPAPAVPRSAGATLAKVLKVGDKVKKAKGYSSIWTDKGETGTVTAVPSKLVASMAASWAGNYGLYVDVRWDSCGSEHWCSMGDNNEYELELL